MNSRTVSHTATQARLIMFLFFFFFLVRFLQKYLCFRELHYRSQYIELLLRCLAAGKTLTCIISMFLHNLFNGSFRQYFSIYHVVSKRELIGREREREREGNNYPHLLQIK